jgi:hypothetical protein
MDRPVYSWRSVAQGVTLPERRQSSSASKRQTYNLHSQWRLKSLNLWPSDEADDETFALMPSFLQGYTLLDAVSAVSFPGE